MNTRSQLVRKTGLSLLTLVLAWVSTKFSVGPLVMIYALGPLLALRKTSSHLLFAVLISPSVFYLGFANNFIGLGAFLSLVVIGLIYSELEKQDVDVLRTGFVSLAISLSLAFIVATYFVKKNDIDIAEQFKSGFSLMKAELAKTSPNLQVDEEKLLVQIPSAVVVWYILALWFGLIIERQLRKVFRLIPIVKAQSLKMTFRLPDQAAWLLVVSIGGAFVEHPVEPLKVAAVNIFNVLAILYFFQGIAVVATFFSIKRTRAHWRFLGYTILIFQLPFALSVLGLVDYWMDFRRRIIKGSARIA